MPRDFALVTAKELGSILRDYRKSRRMTQAQLAAELVTSQRIVSLIEADPSGSRLETIHRMCAALGLELVIRQRQVFPQVEATDGN